MKKTFMGLSILVFSAFLAIVVCYWYNKQMADAAHTQNCITAYYKKKEWHNEIQTKKALERDRFGTHSYPTHLNINIIGELYKAQQSSFYRGTQAQDLAVKTMEFLPTFFKRNRDDCYSNIAQKCINNYLKTNDSSKADAVVVLLNYWTFDSINTPRLPIVSKNVTSDISLRKDLFNALNNDENLSFMCDCWQPQIEQIRKYFPRVRLLRFFDLTCTQRDTFLTGKQIDYLMKINLEDFSISPN